MGGGIAQLPADFIKRLVDEGEVDAREVRRKIIEFHGGVLRHIVVAAPLPRGRCDVSFGDMANTPGD